STRVRAPRYRGDRLAGPAVGDSRLVGGSWAVAGKHGGFGAAGDAALSVGLRSGGGGDRGSRAAARHPHRPPRQPTHPDTGIGGLVDLLAAPPGGRSGVPGPGDPLDRKSVV